MLKEMGKQLTLAWLEMYNFSYLEQTTQDAVRRLRKSFSNRAEKPISFNWKEMVFLFF